MQTSGTLVKSLDFMLKYWSQGRRKGLICILRSLLLLYELEGGKNGRERYFLDIESTGLANGLKAGSKRIIRNEG